jgi:undecaprenyl-diphosphatase
VSLAELDRRGLRVARTVGHTPSAERAVAAFSKTGEHAASWLALGLAGAALDAPRRTRWLRAAGMVGAAFFVNSAIKLVVRRRRPDLPGYSPLVGTPTGLSFPSAHTTCSFVGAAQYSRMGLPSGPLHLLAAAYGWSRLYLGVHYPSDIVAGAVLGATFGRTIKP